MNVIAFLADAAQEVGGKLYILGGGWTFIGPDPSPSALVLMIHVDWHEANQKLALRAELQDEDGNLARVGQGNLVAEGVLEVGRPPGHPQGVGFTVPIAMSFPPLQLEPGKRFAWVVTIDGKTEPHWRVAFSTRPNEQGPAVTRPNQ